MSTFICLYLSTYLPVKHSVCLYARVYIRIWFKGFELFSKRVLKAEILQEILVWNTICS
jgi:hypothetical protein